MDLGQFEKEEATRTDRPAVDLESQTVTLHYRYPYEIDLERINSERDLLAWALHLCEKNWMDTRRIAETIETIAKVKGFKVHGLY